MIAVTRGAREALAADKARAATLRDTVQAARAAVAAQPLTLEQANKMIAERWTPKPMPACCFETI